MSKRFLILFCLTLLLSCVIRFYELPQNPEGFDQDEASFGYNAYSILKTGRDEYGKFLPLFSTSFGDYKLAGYMYWQIPFIAVFGLSEFSTRLSTAVSAIITLLLIYFIVNQLFKNRQLALMTFLVTSITPWHLILSRMAYDPIIALMFCLASVALFICWYKTERVYFLLFSAVSLSLGIMTYYAVWVIFPFMILAFWISIYKKPGRITSLWLTTTILLLPILMAVILFLTTQGQRLYQDSTFQNTAYPLLEEQIRQDQQQLPIFITRMFHNKVLFYPQIMLQNLSNNLSIDFLFLRGDKMDRRFFVPYQGVLLFWTAPFVLFGLLHFCKHNSLSKNLLLLSLIFLIFLGSSFSEFGSEAERTLFAAPLFCLLISYGLLNIYQTINRPLLAKFFLGVFGLILVANIAFFNHQYYWHANVHEPWGRNFGMRQMLEAVAALEGNYQKIIIPDSAYIFYYFYNQTDPRIAWKEAAKTLDQKNVVGLNLRSEIGNYLTMPIACPAAGKLHVLYVCQGTRIPKNSKIIQVIRFGDDQPAFILIEFMPTLSTDPLPLKIEYIKNYGIISAESDVYWKNEIDIDDSNKIF